MFSIWTLAWITGLYVLVLFAVAFAGNRVSKPPRIVYSLALGIHCTSWAFFGTSTQALQFGWPIVPTYLGVVLVMFFGFSVLKKIARLCRQYKISSLADFIGIEYQHANALAAIVVILCFIGVIPYIALQLDAISSAISLMTNSPQSVQNLTELSISSQNSMLSGSISLYVAIFMAIFAIVFGSRTLNLTTKRNGLMFTIAFESILKLLGLCAVGLYCVYALSDGWVDLLARSLDNPVTRETLETPFATWIYMSHIVLGIASMFILPRQFHINFVENNNDAELNQARWVLPCYLLLMTIFVLPIALSGQLLLSPESVGLQTGNLSSDDFVLQIPISQNNHLITLLAYIGGLAASTSMIIVATLALGNMVANNLLTPLFLYSKALKKGRPKLSAIQLLRIRQGTIIILLIIAYWYHQNVSQAAPLVKSGTIAIALMSQILPAMLLGLYWRRMHAYAAAFGIITGAAIVAGQMLYPAILSSYYFAPVPSDTLFANAIFISLAINTAICLLGSVLGQSRLKTPFLENKLMRVAMNIEVTKLRALLVKVLPQNVTNTFEQKFQARELQSGQTVPIALQLEAEQVLAEHVGNASARILLNAVADTDYDNTQELSELVEMATQSFQFNHEVLQSSIAHLPQGISVVDSDLKLVAWNQQYERLFDYPAHFLKHGMPVKALLEFNAQRGLLNEQGHKANDKDLIYKAIDKRLSLMRDSKAYKYLRQHANDKTIEISGNPLPGGGYITSFTDISEYIAIQQQLEQSKKHLEQRVAKRTEELEAAKLEAEAANISKSRFLAATGHDLMQPFNAASLFASMLHEKLAKSELQPISRNLMQSLESADSLLSMLIEITKLETGKITPSYSHFCLDDLLGKLLNEFSVIAAQKQLSMHYVKTSVWVNTDRRLLSRMIQNLLANAIRYTDSGKILIGVRHRQQNRCEIMVVDTGRGIAKANQSRIFNEFQRIESTSDHSNSHNSQGLGLGLTIVERTANLLGIDIHLTSTLGKGTAFGLSLAKAIKGKQHSSQSPFFASDKHQRFLSNKEVLILENDEQIAQALGALLGDWGAKLSFARDGETALNIDKPFDIVIADYHLDREQNGVDVCMDLVGAKPHKPLLILSSADRSEAIQARAIENGMRYLPKPVKSAALKRLIQSRLSV